MKLYFKINERLKKIFNYFSIFTIVLGTTFGSLSNAYSAELVIDAGTDTDLDATPATSDGTVLSASPTTDALTLEDVEVIDLAAGSGTVASLTSDTDSTTDEDSTLTISGTTALTITGDVTSKADANLTITVDDAATNSLIIGGNVTPATGEPISFIVEGANSSFLGFNGSSAQTIAATIDSDNAATDGTVKVSGAAAKTFTLDIGATDDLGLFVVGSADNADTSAIFNENLTVTTLAIGDSGSGTTTDDTLAVTFEAGTTQTVTANIINYHSNDSATINIYNTNDTGGAPLVTTIAGTIAASGDSIDNINIGSSTAGGSAVFSGAIATGTAGETAVTITGGDADAEDSSATFANTTTVTSFTLNDNTGTATLVFSGNKVYTGTIDAATAGEGTLSINNATGATIASAVGTTSAAIGTINIGTAAANSVATFDGSVTASSGIVLGANDGDHSATVNFESQAANNTITADISSSDSGDTVVIGVYDAGTTTAALNSVTFANAIDVATASDTIQIGTSAGNGSGGHAVFSSSVTASTINIEGQTASNSIADFKGDVTATAIVTDDNTGDALVYFSGTSAQTIAGTINAAAGDSIVYVTNTNTTTGSSFSSKIGATGQVGEIQIGTTAAGYATFDETIDTDLLDIVKGKATLKKAHASTAATQNTVERLTIADGATLQLSKDITNGMTVMIGGASQIAADVASGAKIIMPINLSSGQSLVLIDGLDDTIEENINTSVENALVDTAIINYTATAGDDTGDGNDDAYVTVTAAAKSSSTAASEMSVTVNQATSLLQAYNSAINDTNADSSAEDAFLNALQAQGGYSATEDTALAKQVAPQDDMISGSSVAAQAVTGSVQGIMSSRMASLRSGDAYFGTGVAAGGMSAQSGFIQVFGSTAEQNNTTVGSGTQYGYESDTEGLAIGFDGVTDDGMTIGVSLATANTDVDGKGTGKSTNSIDTYSASLYMDRATDAGYVEGSVTFGLNENSTSRKVNTAGLDRTYTGSYDSQSLSVNISAGAPIESGSGYLTPFGSFTASFMDIDAYTEKSTVANDALRLKVAQDDVNSMIGTLGIKYHAEMGNGGTPMISLAINNEFGDTTIDSTNTYQGGGTAFKTSTAVEELSATLGLGYSYGSDTASIELAYEADVNDDDYLSHYGSIKLVGKF